LAFPATGFGRLIAVGGAFQSELLCASSDPLIEKTANASVLEQLAAEFRDFIDLSHFEFTEIHSAARLLRFCNRELAEQVSAPESSNG